MFWKFFSGAFGLVLGILLAFIAFIIILAVILGLSGYFEEKTKCLRCQEKRKNKIILATKKYPTEKLCPDCKEA
jgi:hypothetical protein